MRSRTPVSMLSDDDLAAEIPAVVKLLVGAERAAVRLSAERTIEVERAQGYTDRLEALAAEAHVRLKQWGEVSSPAQS